MVGFGGKLILNHQVDTRMPRSLWGGRLQLDEQRGPSASACIPGRLDSRNGLYHGRLAGRLLAFALLEGAELSGCEQLTQDNALGQ